MENYAIAKRKNPLTSVTGIIFMVAGAVFLLPYMVVSLPSLFTFFISLFKVFANLFTFKLSLAFASLTPLLSSFVDLLQCFVGPVALVMAFVLMLSHNEEKASVFAVLNLITTLVTLFSGRVSMETPAWAINVLADLVLAFALLACSLSEGKVRKSSRWLIIAIIACVIRIVGMVFAMQKGTYIYLLEYYPVYEYEGFVASYRQFVTAVLEKKNPAVELNVQSYTFNQKGFAENWRKYMNDIIKLDTIPRSAVEQYDGSRNMAAGIVNGVESMPMAIELMHIISYCVMTVVAFLAATPMERAAKD